jgi:hypothetical protein
VGEDGGERERNINEPTMRGNQFDQSAQERMIIKNPTARTKESRITAMHRGVLFIYLREVTWRGRTFETCGHVVVSRQQVHMLHRGSRTL